MKSRLTPEAELDLIEAIRWYDEGDQELGMTSYVACTSASVHWKGILAYIPSLIGK